MSFTQLWNRAAEIYPKSRKMQRAWTIQSFRLYATGRHALITGGWKNGVR